MAKFPTTNCNNTAITIDLHVIKSSTENFTLRVYVCTLNNVKHFNRVTKMITAYQIVDIKNHSASVVLEMRGHLSTFQAETLDNIRWQYSSNPFVHNTPPSGYKI